MIVGISESISGAKEGQPSKLGYECRKVLQAGADIKPGRFVCRKDADSNCKAPTTMAEALACIGFTVLSDTIPLDSDGEYASGKFVPLFSKSPGVWAVTIDAATKGGQVYVNYAGSNPAGSVSAAFVSGENVALPGARFGSTQATPGGLAEIEFDLPGSAPALDGAQSRTVVAAVHYESTGTTWDFVGGVQPSGVTVTDVGVGVFRLTVAGAASVLPAGQPCLKLATPLVAGATGGVAKSVQVIAIAATTIDFAVQSQQADDQLFDVLDLADNDIIYCPLFITYA
jgi:hypothetical protein